MKEMIICGFEGTELMLCLVGGKIWWDTIELFVLWFVS